MKCDDGGSYKEERKGRNKADGQHSNYRELLQYY